MRARGTDRQTDRKWHETHEKNTKSRVCQEAKHDTRNVRVKARQIVAKIIMHLTGFSHHVRLLLSLQNLLLLLYQSGTLSIRNLSRRQCPGCTGCTGVTQNGAKGYGGRFKGLKKRVL